MSIAWNFLTICLWAYALTIGVWGLWWLLVKDNPGKYPQRQKEQLYNLIDNLGFEYILFHPQGFFSLTSCMVSQLKLYFLCYKMKYQCETKLRKNLEKLNHYLTHSYLSEINYYNYCTNIYIFSDNILCYISDLEWIEQEIGYKSQAVLKVKSLKNDFISELKALKKTYKERADHEQNLSS